MGLPPHQASAPTSASLANDVATAKKRAASAQELDPAQDGIAQNGTPTLEGQGQPVKLEEAAVELAADYFGQVSEEDRRKLLVVLESLDPTNILQQHVTIPELGLIPLQQAIASPATLVPALRTAINDAATSALFDSFDATKETLNAIEEYRRTAVALLDEIESRGRSRGVKREVEDADEPNLAPPTKKFMLHRGLATMDIFTSAASLTDAELAQLAAAEDTDVIAVQPGPKPSAALPETPAPTLGALNPRPIAPAPPIAPPEPTPVQLLYYDPFQSFAPSYDSTASTLSYAESTSYRLSKNRLKRWEDDLALVDSTPFPPPIASTSAIAPSPKLELTEAEKELLREAGVESEQLEEGWEGVEQELKVWDTIQTNGELLGKLMKSQRRRLREGQNEVGPGEAEAATRLHDSFSALLATRPHSSSSSTALVPSASSIHSALPTLLASMAREPAYQGTLDPQNQRAVRESAMGAGGGGVNGQLHEDQMMGGY